MPPNDARSPKASSQAARLEPRWHGSTMSAHRLCHGSFPLIGPDWLILTTQSDDRIRSFCRPSPPLAAMPALAPKPTVERGTGTMDELQCRALCGLGS